MRWAYSLPRWLAVAAAGLLSVSLVAALVDATSGASQPPLASPPLAKIAKPREVVPLFTKTEPAANTPALILLPDERGVRGWVAGDKSYAGSKVTISAGRNFETTVGDDNTFAVTASYPKPMPVMATVAAPAGGKSLTARTTLPAKVAGTRNTAFVITDRSAYRPGHTLKFVAYLHETSDGVEFKPLANRDFTVDLTSETRKTRAAQLKLRSDAEGRLTGQYTFSDADALDHYRLHVIGTDASAAARVLLGEYRKTKVGLKLKGEVKDGKLVVTFDARDYLDRPVKGTSATWNATITKAADVAKLALEPTKFVMNEGGPPSIDDFDALPDDERLLTLANGVSATSFAGFGGRTLATREGKAEFTGDKPGTVSIDLWSEWLRGQHSVTVSGVFIDETGRENFSVGTFSLSPPDARGVIVNTSKEMYATGEKVPVSVVPFGIAEKDAHATTVIVVKLDAAPTAMWVHPVMADPNGDFVPDNTRIPPLSETKPAAKKPAPLGWQTVPVFDPVKRKVLTAVPVVKGKTEVDLKQPGAYKLLAVTRLADGTVLQSETGVVVKPQSKLPGLVIQPDSRELPAGGRLSGTVHTRFAGAKLLLTLRDSSGVKLAKTLTAGANGVARYDEALPPNLRYGCSVCVQYPESASNIHADQRDLFVIPTDRTLTVTTTTPDTVGPGAEVKLGIQVNREEEVDLAVSVFDESLLGVSGDLSGSIRDYYLADARGQGRAARDLTATRLGTISIAELVLKAEKMLKDKDALAKEPGLDQRLKRLVVGSLNRLTLDDVVTLVRLAGFEIYLAHPVHGFENLAKWAAPQGTRLADLFRRDTVIDGGKYYLSATVINNVVLLGLANRDTGYDPWVMHRGNFAQMPPVCYGGFQCHGFGIHGAICGGFQCVGFGSTFSGPGFGGHHFSAYGYPGISGFGGFGGSYGIGGFGGISGFGGGGFGGGIGGGYLGQFGNLGGQFGIGKGGIPPTVAGFNGSFSYPFVGGQMGMSFGHNRDFGPPAGVPIGAPMPGLGLADEVVRRDFADSAYWTATLRTDKTGKATASFKVPDSLTNWRVQVTAVSPKLHVGTASGRFKTSRPVMIWPMLPRAFAEGDTVRVFGTVHNLSDQEQNVRVHLKTENGEVLSGAEHVVKVPARGNVPVYWTYKAGKPGMADLIMSAKCDAGSDASHKKLPVVSSTVPERVTASGIVGKSDLKLVMPEGFNAESAQVNVTVAPTLAADLADTLPYLVDYPYGCVEQTMSRFLPALRVAHILRQSGLTTIKQLEEKLPKVVAAGQKRLIELQQPDGGWGWQGSGVTHEMMTPYALLGLIAAEEAGYPSPNPQTIPRGLARLKQYLESQRLILLQGTDKPRLLNDAMYSFAVYASKAEPTELNDWWRIIGRNVGKESLSDYGHAIALELAVKFDKKELAGKIRSELNARATKSGDRVYWTKAGFSNWGDNTTEVTAAVMKALVAHDSSDPLIPGILAYFHSTKRGDRWDSTKDTAVVLYALCDYLAAVRAGPAAAGIVKIALNGVESGNVRLDSAASRSVKFAGKGLKAGENSFSVKGADATGGALVRVTVTFVRANGALTPARDHGVKVARTVSLRGADGKWTELKSGASVPVGSYVKVRVTAEATDKQPLRYFLIESTKPAGCETIAADDKRFPAPQETYRHVLREDRESMSCFHYEHAPGPVGTEFVVLAEFAGEFTLPPARGEFMYQPTSGGHSDSFVLKVAEKK